MPKTDALPLLKQYARAFEAYHVSEYVLHREKKGGATQTVTVKVFDGGPERRDLRYHAEAHGDDGTFATGNAAESVDLALAIVHWDELDN
jgi:hypothetical protein